MQALDLSRHLILFQLWDTACTVQQISVSNSTSNMIPMAPLDTGVEKLKIADLASHNTEPQGAQTEYSKAKYHNGEITLQDFLLPDDDCIDVPYDAFDPDAKDVLVINLQNPCRQELLQEIVQAAESPGFFIVTNHGVAVEVIQRLEGHIRRFFELPMDAKLNARCGLTPGMCGFVAGSPMFLASRWWAESLQLDWNETRMHNILRETLSNDTEFQEFRVDYSAYMKGLGELSHSVLNLLAEGIGLASTAFTTELQTGDEQGTMTFNYYPACPRPDKVWGLLAHRDTSMVSILHQDCVGGLQINRHGEWLGVAPVPSSFVVNVGDMLKVTSNGRFESALHRVVTNPAKPRLSMAYFCNTVDEAVISAAPELIIRGTLPFTYAEYSCMPFRPSDFTSIHEYRPQRLDFYKVSTDQQCHTSDNGCVQSALQWCSPRE